MVEKMFFLDSEHIGRRRGESLHHLPATLQPHLPPTHPHIETTISIEWKETNSIVEKFSQNSPRRISMGTSHQRNFNWVIILAILACIMHKCINLPISHFIQPLNVIFLHWRRINIINKINGNIRLMIDKLSVSPQFHMKFGPMIYLNKIFY